MGRDLGGSGWCLVSVAVDAFAQFFSDGEEGDAFCGDFDGGASFGVSSGACVTVFDGEATEATDLDAFAADERFAHAAEDGVDDLLDIFFGEIVPFFADNADQFAFCHLRTPFAGQK